MIFFFFPKVISLSQMTFSFFSSVELEIYNVSFMFWFLYSEALIDRGWRRSGCYLYKHEMDKTCCPPYAIRLKASDFVPSKEQQRVSRRLERCILLHSCPFFFFGSVVESFRIVNCSCYWPSR